MFRDYDRDCSGELDEAEFRLAFRRLRVEPFWIDDIWSHSDASADGQVDLKEFKVLWAEVQNRRLQI